VTTQNRTRVPTPPTGTTLRPRTELRPHVRSEPEALRGPDRYAHGTVSFLPPAEWRSVAVFTGPVEPGGRVVPTVTVTREPLRGDTLGKHANELLSMVGAAAPGFALLQTSKIIVAGRAAILVRFGVDGQAGRLEQTMVMVDPLGDADVTTFHASGSRDAAPAMREMLDALLYSVRFTEARASAPPPRDPVESYVAELIPSVPMPGLRTRR
jgi:hypothetical protein